MKTLIIHTLMLFSLGLFAGENCQKFLDDCEYYTCMSTAKSCGENSYFTNFGLKYCTKFASAQTQFSPAGLLWMETTRGCLIRGIDKLDEALTCGEYKTEAVKQHTACYVNSGFCSLSKEDRKVVIKVVRATMWRPSMLRAATKVLKACSKISRENSVH